MTLFPIAYFGSIRYFQDLISLQSVCFETNDHFPKQTYRNRTVILCSQGRQLLTVPLIKENGSKTLTKDIQISYSENWQLIQWRAIQTAYASAPYFEHYASDIHELIFSKTKFLIDKNEEILNFFIDTWQLPVDYSYTTEYKHETSEFLIRNFEVEKMYNQYTQVLYAEAQFDPAISILDILFCEGPMARNILCSIESAKKN